MVQTISTSLSVIARELVDVMLSWLLLCLQVQRLELSEVAAGISRLKHAESNDHITEVRGSTTLYDNWVMHC